MTSEERERAERIARTLRPTDPGSWELSTVYVLDELAAFAREERARVWEEAADRVGPHDDLRFEWRLKAKMLREDGR